MGANDGFTPDNKGTDKEQVPTSNFTYKHPIPEQPLTHHQQAVKDFMVAILSGFKGMEPFLLEEFDIERVAKFASRYADAFINQINKKP